MKRTQQQRLEYESRLALRASLPKGWIVRDQDPDVGIDMEIETVENEIVTNKVIWVQVKATESKKSAISKIPSYPMETEHLKYYESCRIPVIIVYGIKKSENVFNFYSLFAQEYIEKYLSVADPKWRNKKTKTVNFKSKLNIKDLDTIATKGYLYIAAQQLNISPAGAQYWLDGIPKSDDKELQKRTLKALLYSRAEKFPEAIKELENILKLCILSPTEKMSVLLNLGNAFYSLSRIDDALTNYEAVIELTKKVTEKEALEGMSAALGNIGLIYSAKGELDSALKYLQDAMKIHREIGYKQGEANQLGNIGLIYSDKGELDSALKYYQDAMKILDTFKLVYGRDIIENAIKRITTCRKKDS